MPVIPVQEVRNGYFEAFCKYRQNCLLLLLTIYAWPRPDPALDTFKTSRPANPKIQSNKSKTFFIEILSANTALLQLQPSE